MGLRITIKGAGILGLWQALTLARAGHQVRLLDTDTAPLSSSASAQAGAMLAPDCEAEAAPDLVRDEGRRALELWIATVPGIARHGTLVTGLPRDLGDLGLYAKRTERHVSLSAGEISALEPDLGGRFVRALHYPAEAHLVPHEAMAFLLEAAIAAGLERNFGTTGTSFDGEPESQDLLIDCRGLAARDILPDLRGVRGERLLIRTDGVSLKRPVRLLHPRHPIYVVPWGDGRFLIGATMIESEDPAPITVRSALELLGAAYALVPAFGEAVILEATSGLRPAFPDNVPRARVLDAGRLIAVNGAYRHGFLLAPVLAEAVAAYISDRTPHPLLEVCG